MEEEHRGECGTGKWICGVDGISVYVHMQSHCLIKQSRKTLQENDHSDNNAKVQYKATILGKDDNVYRNGLLYHSYGTP